MSGQKKFPVAYTNTKKPSHLDHFLDFGPEKAANSAQEISTSGIERIKQIVKKLEEINKRIDDLSQRF